MTQSIQQKYIDSFMEFIGIDLPYELELGSNSIVRIYPEKAFFGNLNVHLEGAIRIQGDERAFAHLVIFIHNQTLQNQVGYSVIGCTFNNEDNSWSELNLYIDEFDEFHEPQREPMLDSVSEIDASRKLSLKEVIEHSFKTTFSDQHDQTHHYVSCLSTGLGLFVHCEPVNNTSDVNISFKLNGNQALVGRADKLTFKLNQKSNVLEFCN